MYHVAGKHEIELEVTQKNNITLLCIQRTRAKNMGMSEEKALI